MPENVIHQSNIPGKKFALVALVLILGLYLPYFFVPVVPEPYGGPGTITGWEGLSICFVLPPLWPIAAGHVLLWIGCALLGFRYWWLAAALGILALVLSLFFVVGMLLGYWLKILSMTVLIAAGLIGGIRFRQQPQKDVP